jgi:cytochrome d ubiquinol oxidase subunit II
MIEPSTATAPLTTTAPMALDGGPLLGLPLAELWFGLVFFVLATFLFLDGFDFGVGVLFALQDDAEVRETMLAAIGPFWDGNEVWLVVFGGVLFAAFPAAYANLFSRHYLLMFAILGALILRGLAPEFYEQRHDEAWQTWWGRAFVAGSVAAPFFLGMFAANWMVGATGTFTVAGALVGLAVVALTVVDGAAFLRVKTRGDLQDAARGYGVSALVAYLGLVVVAVGYLALTRPALRSSLASPAVLGLLVLSVVLGGAFVAATRADRHYLAFGTVAGLVAALVGVVATTTYPYVDPAAGLLVEDAIISTLPLNLMTVGSSILLPLVFVYFAVLYSAFSGPMDADEGYGAGE